MSHEVTSDFDIVPISLSQLKHTGCIHIQICIRKGVSKKEQASRFLCCFTADLPSSACESGVKPENCQTYSVGVMTYTCEICSPPSDTTVRDNCPCSRDRNEHL